MEVEQRPRCPRCGTIRVAMQRRCAACAHDFEAAGPALPLPGTTPGEPPPGGRAALVQPSTTGPARPAAPSGLVAVEAKDPFIRPVGRDRASFLIPIGSTVLVFVLLWFVLTDPFR